jgi:hypothetical protein
MASRTTVARKKAKGKRAKRKKAKTPKRPGPVVIRVPEHAVEIVSAPIAGPLVADADRVDKLAAWLLQQADLSGA